MTDSPGGVRPAPGSTGNLERLKALLREMFQLDRGDLDFGLYRIMNLMAGEVEGFLDNDLLPQVKSRLKLTTDEERARAEEELKGQREAAFRLGVDPDEAPAIIELNRRLAEMRKDAQAEADVYAHLANFFGRYYTEGDFVSQRRYAAGGASTYLIPYDGEEVKLHWANADQYYIKTTENFASYVFTMGEADGRRRVRFEVATADSEKDNNQAAPGRKRRFVLAPEGAVAVVGDDLVVRFAHRPLADGEKKKWPGNGNKQQAAINEAAASWVLRAAPDDWRALFEAPAPTEANGERTVLEMHLDRYTARNTFDYFIHKDLGGFLRRQLDLYLNSEVLLLDDLETGDAPRLDRALARVRAIRHIGGKIIAFLAQLEEFQKRLWLKKKFVLESEWCVTLDRAPESLYPEIAANDAQRAEWVRLFAMDEINGHLGNGGAGYCEPLTVEFLKHNPFLVLDTRHFDTGFKDRLLEALSDAGPLDEQTDGLLIHGENFQALNLLQGRYAGRVQCIYIDPPYNTGNDGFVYKDAYRHSTWISMIRDRLALGRILATRESAILVSIDETEQRNLRWALDETWGAENHVAEMVWSAGRKNDSRFISLSHEYIAVYARDQEWLTSQGVEWKQRKKGLDDIYRQYRKLVRSGGDHDSMTAAMKKWFSDLPDSHPAKAHRHYCHVDAKGIYFPDNVSWPGGGGPRYEVLHPVTGKPVKVPARGWMTADPEKMKAWIEEDRIHFGAEGSVPSIKSYLKDREYQTPYSVFYRDGRGATKRLRDVLGSDVYGYPKDEQVIAESIGMLASGDDLVLDYFAGSGTTAHAVIELNRDDGGRRKYILAEMGAHFDAVLLPRIKKVIHSRKWKDGRPQGRDGVSQLFRVVRIESYEDAMDSLVRTPPSRPQQELLAGDPGLAEDYRLCYALGVETAASATLLGKELRDPFAHTLSVVRDGVRRDAPVDLPETFNLLLGLSVEARRRIEGVLTITGTDGEGRRCLILWRNLDELDHAALDGWFARHRERFGDALEVIWTNGDHTLNAMRRKGEGWTAETIEPVLRERMFASEP